MPSFRTTLAHLFHPRRSNNHRARVLHPEAFPVYVVICLVVGVLIQLSQYWPKHWGDVLGFASSITPSDVVEHTNRERARVGASQLVVNQTLSQAALSKGQDMFSKQYWAHTSPEGKQPWAFMSEAGYVYQVAGENLARDFSNTPDMVQAWMASPTHRANILNPKYTEIGIAVIDGTLEGMQTTLVVQMFGTPRTIAAVPQVSEEAPQVQAIETQVQPTPFAQVLASTLVPVGEVRTPILLSPIAVTKSFFLAIIMMLVTVLVYDSVVIGNRSMIRLVGKNMGHIIFLLVVAFLLILFKGGIVS